MTTARLRTWILVLAAALIAAIAVFFLHARWLGRLLSQDVPSELAKSIQQSTQGFTHSESRGGHTIYTLHASKAVQFKSDGHAELHDVSITLFNAQGAPANRIYGNAFDWDAVHGIARALGEVHIDLQGSPSADPAAAGNDTEEDESKNTVHLKTSGLVFNKQTGLATTTERIEFRLAAAAGSAVGASFDSQTGVVILDTNVAFNSSAGGSPLSLRAHHAQFDRESRLLYLLQDVTDYEDGHSSSDQATVTFRPDGSASQVEAEGHVVLTGSDGQTINTRQAHIDLGPKSEPRQATMNGGLLYVATSNARQLHGSASSGTLLLGPQTTIRHAQLRDAVSLVDVETFAVAPVARAGKAKQNPPQSSSRQVQATRVDVDFSTGPDRSLQVQRILATGGARLNVHTIYTATPPQDTTVTGDQLLATLTSNDVLSSLRGTGHTGLVDVSPAGVKQAGAGDNLLLTFAPARQSAAGKIPQQKAETADPQAIAQLQSAVQWGNVSLTQEAPPDAAGGKNKAGNSSSAVGHPAASEVTTAFADRAAYDAASQKTQLSGNPRIRNVNGEIGAGMIEMEQTTGNANATGGVKATYRQAAGQPGGGSSGPGFSGPGVVHVIADRAHLDRSPELTTFYGRPGAAARLWQGSDSVAAPVLELSRVHATLTAHGAGGDGAAVAAVFTSEEKPGEKKDAASATGRAAARPLTGNMPVSAPSPSMVRLQSRTLLYNDAGRKATFSGGVVAQGSTGTLHASTMDVYLTAASPQSTSKMQDQPGSKVDRIVAQGAVELSQPGRKGTGEELTYTAADGKFVLTGTAAAPPRLVDQVRGAVTGTSLIFNDRDDSVIVSGGASKTVTQTRVAR